MGRAQEPSTPSYQQNQWPEGCGHGVQSSGAGYSRKNSRRIVGFGFGWEGCGREVSFLHMKALRGGVQVEGKGPLGQVHW